MDASLPITDKIYSLDVSALKQFSQNGAWELIDPVVEVKCAPSKENLQQCRAIAERIDQHGR